MKNRFFIFKTYYQFLIRMWKIYILLVLLLCSNNILYSQNYNFNSDKKLTQYIIDNWTKDEGLTTNSLLDICQTQDGYIWISSYNGLMRFNGKNFKVFDKNNTSVLKENGIGAIIEDKNGTLWMATQSSGLISYKNGKFESHLTDKNLNHLYSVIYIDNEDRIWGASPEVGWFIYKNGKYKFLKYSTPLKNIELADVTQNSKNIFWIATSGNGLFKYDNSKFTNYTKENGLVSNWVNVSKVDKNDLLWIGADKGLCTYNGKKFTEIPEFKDISVNAITFDENQNMWIGTRKGLFLKKKNSEKYEVLNTQNGLFNNFIIKILIDNENSLWLLNYRGGLSRLKNGKFTCYSKKDKLLGKMTNAICEIAPNIMLVGFDNGTINKIENNNVTEYKTKSNLIGKRIRNIYKDSKNNIWISTYSGLLKTSPNGDEKWYSPKTGFPGKYIRVVFEDSKKNIWIGTRNTGIIKIEKDKTFTVFNKAKGLSVNLIMSIDEDKNGNIIVGTSKGGLNIISDDKIFSIYTNKEGLTGDIIFNTYVDKEGKIWIAAVGGLNCITNGKITSFPVSHNALPDSPFNVLEDNFGNFWMPCSKGIMLVSKQNLVDFENNKIDKLPYILYNKYDGLPNAECTATAISLKAENGTLWFPTLDGIATINPHNIPTNTYTPPVYIEELIIDRKSVALSDNLIIEPDKKRFEFKFNDLSYYEPEKNFFKYKLEGFENEWSEKTKNRSISYTNLPHGNYSFKVIACNNDGLWNETGDEFSFNIKPHIYQTIWFYALVIILSLLIIFLVFYIRVRRLKNRQKKLEETIKKRTSEIQSKNEKLFQQKEEIAAQAEKLEKSNKELEKLTIVARETDNAILIYDNKFDLQWANDAFAKIYGYTFSRKENINLIKQNKKTQIRKLIDDSITKRISVSYESKNENSTGKVVWVQTTLTPIFKIDKLDRIIAIESDITEIKRAQIEISEQNLFIKSSINYAKTIQEAILPIQRKIDNYLDNFIIYRPKEVVSGDFYWFSVIENTSFPKEQFGNKNKIDKLLFFAVVDCTGHGVPGAFMSMIGNSLLNEIINKEKIYSPKEILTKLNTGITKSLKQDVNENHDGMDVCLCRLDIPSDENNPVNLVFAGAKRPLLYHKFPENEINQIKGDRRTIGGVTNLNKKSFTNQELTLHKNDTIYLTSDGFIDQNNKERKRFGTNRVIKILNEIKNKKLSEQKQILESELEKWKENERQRDDITFIGIKI